MFSGQKKSVRLMLLIPTILLNITIIGIFLIVIRQFNIFQHMKESDIRGLSHSVEYRGKQVEQSLKSVADLTRVVADGIGQDINTDMSLESVYHELVNNPQAVTQILGLALPHVHNTLEMSAASGAFVALNVSPAQPGTYDFSGNSVAAVYIKSQSGATGRSGDFTLLAGPRDIADAYRIPLAREWDVELNRSLTDNWDFLTVPYAAAKNGPVSELERLGYWSGPVELGTGERVLYYTAPLLDGENVPYGVVGMELSLSRLNEILAAMGPDEWDGSFYAFAEISDPNRYEWLAADGFGAGNLMAPRDGGAVVRQLSDYAEPSVEITFDDSYSAIAVVHDLQIYYTESLIPQQRWALVGGVETKVLFAGFYDLSRYLTIALMLALAAGLVGAILVVNALVGPLRRLPLQLQSLDPDAPIQLDYTRIREIDLLIDSIKGLSADLAASGARTLLAIEMTDMPIAFLEVNAAKKRVFITDLVFELFAIPKEGSAGFIAIDEWTRLYERLSANKVEGEENTFLLDFIENRPERWLKVKMAEGGKKNFGIIIDVTGEVMERRRLEYERDTDPLTKLLNRQAFFRLAGEKIQSTPDKLGVMLFADLDNLKYVNDTWGHDSGDRYIRAAADVFARLDRYGAVVSRISGDEFAIFLYGYDSREELAGIVGENYKALSESTLELTDSAIINIRGSIGFSWYPEDSKDLGLLLKYADFAMYETKRTAKGCIKEFDIASYMKKSSLIEKHKDFDRFIELNQVSYDFQPIVEIYSGQVYAYEALMRPQCGELTSPLQVLEIAQTQAKLYQIERMTVYNMFNWTAENLDHLDGKKIFLNSLPNQLLSEKDEDELITRYPGVFGSIVAEVISGERLDEAAYRDKKDQVHLNGGQIALDDFGAGQSGEQTLLAAKPEYIKLGMSLVRNVDLDPDKQRRISKIISSAAPLGIKTIASGVETYQEMECLIKLGVDYLQGFYLAKPTPGFPEVPDHICQEVQWLSRQYRDRRGER